MLVTDLALLRQQRSWPSVSLICEPDGRSIAQLRGEAEQRLAMAAPELSASLLDGLATAGRLVVGSRAPAVALYAAEGFTHAVELPRGVQHRVVIDHTFATRDLVVALARTHRYLVLELDSAAAWLWAGLGDLIRPVGSGGPLLESDRPQGLSRRLQFQERSRRHDVHTAAWLRDVDAAVNAAAGPNDSRPVFVIGNRRLARRFAKLNAGRPGPVSVVGGSVSHRGDTIRSAIGPELDKVSTLNQRVAIDQVAAATGNGLFSGGLSPVQSAALEHRVELLVVEEGFVITADPASTQRTGASVGVLDPLDDVVDELIECVLDGGGRVQPVADGSLHHWGRVAARLRY